MDKTIDRTMVSEIVDYMYVNEIISAPGFIYFMADQGFPDAYFETYCDKYGTPANKSKLIEMGVSCIYAGLITCHSQNDFGMPVENYKKIHVTAVKNMYKVENLAAIGPVRYNNIGWGSFDTIEKKNEMLSQISEYAANLFMDKKDNNSSQAADNFAYFMFNIGITLAMKGNLKKAEDFR